MRVGPAAIYLCCRVYGPVSGRYTRVRAIRGRASLFFVPRAGAWGSFIRPFSRRFKVTRAVPLNRGSVVPPFTLNKLECFKQANASEYISMG